MKCSRRGWKSKRNILGEKTFGAKTTTQQVSLCSVHLSFSTTTHLSDVFASVWVNAPIWIFVFKNNRNRYPLELVSWATLLEKTAFAVLNQAAVTARVNVGLSSSSFHSADRDGALLRTDIYFGQNVSNGFQWRLKNRFHLRTSPCLNCRNEYWLNSSFPKTAYHLSPFLFSSFEYSFIHSFIPLFI